MSGPDKICSKCKKPNRLGGKHYKCATGKERELEKLKKLEVQVVRLQPERL